MGSVKDLEVLKKPTQNALGVGRFIFSDRYSVFDWGEMPDHIPYKGAATALLGAYFFEELEEKGIPTHYVGLVENGRVKKLSDVEKPVNTMEIKLLRVIRPELRGNRYDYSKYREEKGCFLIPLEVIYRNFLPECTSVFRRLKSGEIKPEDMGLGRMPLPGQKLDPPFLDVSTKLEATDRYLSWGEARSISGLNDDELGELKNLANTVNTYLTRKFSEEGIVNEDGKIEFGLDLNRRLIIIDVVGTLDECRLTFDGVQISKEIARTYYRKTEWYQAVKDAKEKDRGNWREICRLKPAPLPAKLKLAISQIYRACTNQITQREWFENVPPLKEVLRGIKETFGSSTITGNFGGEENEKLCG
jgi:phosphoribosylaminoimidazole-succinocarboxamide synthase